MEKRKKIERTAREIDDEKKIVELLIKKSKEVTKSKPRLYGDLEKVDMEEINILSRKIIKEQSEKRNNF